MRTWLLRLQFGLMRFLGIRRLGDVIGSKHDAFHADLAARFEALRMDIVERDRSTHQSLVDLGHLVAGVQADLSALRAEEGGRGRSATERGDTLDVNILQLRQAMTELASLRGKDSLGQDLTDMVLQSIADVRVEMSSMRADMAREMETLNDGVGSTAKSMADTFAHIAGEIRVEVSSMRADMARDMEIVLDGIGAPPGLSAEASPSSFGDIRMGVSSTQADVARGGEGDPKTSKMPAE